MKLPKEIYVGPHTYRVECNDTLLDKEALKANLAQTKEDKDPEDIDGLTDFNNHTIYLRSATVGPQFQKEILFHESLHTVTDMLGIRRQMGQDAEENLVYMLSHALLDFIQRNPKFLAYLTEKEV